MTICTIKQLKNENVNYNCNSYIEMFCFFSSQHNENDKYIIHKGICCKNYNMFTLNNNNKRF